MQYGVFDSKYVVICDAPTLGNVIRRMRITPKRFIMERLMSKLNFIVTAAPESCKVNRQYGVGDSKYVVICDSPTLGHVIRRMHIAPKTLYNGEAHQQTTLYCHRSPLKVAK